MDVTSAPVTLEQVRLNCTLVYRETGRLVDGSEHLIDIRGISRVELSFRLFYSV